MMDTHAGIESAKSFLTTLQMMAGDGRISFLPYGAQLRESKEAPVAVGWETWGGFYLRPQVFRRAAARLAPGLLNELGPVFTFRGLQEMGLIAGSNPGRHTYTIRHASGTISVLWLVNYALDFVIPAGGIETVTPAAVFPMASANRR